MVKYLHFGKVYEKTKKVDLEDYRTYDERNHLNVENPTNKTFESSNTYVNWQGNRFKTTSKGLHGRMGN